MISKEFSELSDEYRARDDGVVWLDVYVYRKIHLFFKCTLLKVLCFPNNVLTCIQRRPQILRNLPLTFVLCSASQKQNFVAFSEYMNFT